MGTYSFLPTLRSSKPSYNWIRNAALGTPGLMVPPVAKTPSVSSVCFSWLTQVRINSVYKVLCPKGGYNLILPILSTTAYLRILQAQPFLSSGALASETQWRSNDFGPLIPAQLGEVCIHEPLSKLLVSAAVDPL